MLHAGKPSADTARQMMNDLATLPRFAGIADSLEMERVMYLDAVIALSHGNLDGDSLRLIGEDKQIAYARHFRVDWNVALRKGNEFYDRFVAAALMKDHAARLQALDQIETDLTQLDPQLEARIRCSPRPSILRPAVTRSRPAQ